MGFLFSLLVPSSTVKVAAVLPARAARSGARAAKSAARVAGSGALAVGFGTLNQGLAPAVSAMVEVAASARVARTGALAAGSPPPQDMWQLLRWWGTRLAAAGSGAQQRQQPATAFGLRCCYACGRVRSGSTCCPVGWGCGRCSCAAAATHKPLNGLLWASRTATTAVVAGMGFGIMARHLC